MLRIILSRSGMERVVLSEVLWESLGGSEFRWALYEPDKDVTLRAGVEVTPLPKPRSNLMLVLDDAEPVSLRFLWERSMLEAGTGSERGRFWGSANPMERATI